MKRVLVLLLAAVFLFAGAAFAADQTKAGAAKAAPKGAAKMTGKIVELSDTALKLERSAKGKTETKDFGLEKALGPDVKVGDKVTVQYVTKDGKITATKVTKATQTAKKSAPKKK